MTILSDDQLAGIPAGWQAVVPNDDADNTGEACICIRAGAAGTVTFRTRRFPTLSVAVSLAAGEVLPGQFTRILATGTTATGIIAGQG